MHSKFGFLSYEISHVIQQRFNKEAEALGFTHGQWRVLAYLSENENCRQIDLAAALEIKPITLVRQIDLLEQMGLVVRKKDHEDRRAHRLQLTDYAKSLLNQLWERADSIEAHLLNVLTQQEQDQLLNWLQRIKNGISSKQP